MFPAQDVRYPRVGVRDVGVAVRGSHLYRGDGGHARPLRFRLRHLPLLPRGPAVLW